MPTTPAEPDFNPYAAPLSEPDDARTADFYRIVSARLRFRELRRMSPNPVSFAILAVPRLLHIPTPFAFPIGVPRLKRLIRVELDRVPQHVRAKWRPIFDACAEHGLAPRFGYTVPRLGAVKEGYAGVLLSEDGHVRGSAIYRRVQVGMTTKEFVTFSASSELADGRWAVTSSGRLRFDPPPATLSRYFPDCPASEILARHRDWLASLGAEAIPMAGSDLEQLALDRERHYIDDLVRRGVLVPMTVRQARRLGRLPDSGPPGTPAPQVDRALRFAGRVAWALLLLQLVLLLLQSPRDRRARSALALIAALTLVLIAFLKALRIRLAARRRRPADREDVAGQG